MENKIDLIKLFKDVAEKYKFSAKLIEKDYHLTRILHKIAENQIDLVFKGGTCLNKCYLGFYRLSGDLDFVYNKDVRKLSKNQIRKLMEKLRREFFAVLGELRFKTNKKLGEGWKMLTSKAKPRIVGLEVITDYKSLIDNSLQTIKIEISFRRKLNKPTKMKVIDHKFVDALGEPVLRKDIKIEVIDLVENFAEKLRALITRKKLMMRDIYDIYFILKNKILAIDGEMVNLILAKVNESKQFTKEDLVEFVGHLNSRLAELNEKEMAALIKTDEKINVKKMIHLIVRAFGIVKK